MIKTAFVKIWGETVGAVAWDESRELASFEYDPAFKRKGVELAPLTMPASSNKNIFSSLRKKDQEELDAFKGMPGLLADSLPDKYGNQLINVWLAQQGRPQNSMNPVEKLCFIGTRGMGALEFEPAQFSDQKRAFQVEVDSLVDIARSMLQKREGFETNINEEEAQAIQQILRIGTSAGGARPKAVIAYNEETGDTQGWGRVEMAYYNMALDCGIDMMPSKLLEENDRAHFLTKRFDREGSQIKHHIQTWCAIKHVNYNDVLSYSYEQLFQTMRELRLTYPEAEQMFRRMVFNVLAKNCDDHTKNFSFRLKQGEIWELAPAYDLCHAYRPGSQWVSQHSLSVNGKREGINREDLMAVAKSMNIKKGPAIIDEVQSVTRNWADYADEVGVSEKLRDTIASTLVML